MMFKFGICCAHKLTPVSYANFEILFEKRVRLRGKNTFFRKTVQQMTTNQLYALFTDYFWSHEKADDYRLFVCEILRVTSSCV